MTGVLRARVGGAWVDILGGAVPPNARFVIDPAYAGAKPDDPTVARFGNVNGDQSMGFMVASDGFTDAIMGAGKSWAFWETAPYPAGNFVGKFYFANGHGRLDIGTRWIIGGHPANGNPSLWANAVADATTGYTLMVDANGNQTRLNSTTTLFLRIANANIVTVDNTMVNAGRQVRVSWSAPNANWDNANFLSNPTASANDQSRIAFNSPGVGPQLRALGSQGEKLACINNPGSGFVPIEASAFPVGSSVTTKREVRPLCERERIIVRHDPRSDLVAQPDIMSLRPVAFRPKVPALRIVPTNGDSYSADDPDSWESVPEIGILGLEGTRERLGLIAEEVETVIPSAVTHDREGNCSGIDYAQITVALLDHVQHLTETIATLQYRITELEGAT